MHRTLVFLRPAFNSASAWQAGKRAVVAAPRMAIDRDNRTNYRFFTMSLSRRACYKCGNVGHYAENCSSTERLCYNCKQPGHESSACPLPRTTEAKQCYHCQGLGHVQADCPTLRMTGGAAPCYNCGKPGHIARLCPEPPTPGHTHRNPRVSSGGMGRGGSRPSTCYKCGVPGHFARECPSEGMKCYACGKTGHISRDCTAPNGGNLNTGGRACYECGEPGHISKDCPQKGASVDDIAAEISGDAAPHSTIPPIA